MLSWFIVLIEHVSLYEHDQFMSLSLFRSLRVLFVLFFHVEKLVTGQETEFQCCSNIWLCSRRVERVVKKAKCSSLHVDKVLCSHGRCRSILFSPLTNTQTHTRRHTHTNKKAHSRSNWMTAHKTWAGLKMFCSHYCCCGWIRMTLVISETSHWLYTF